MRLPCDCHCGMGAFKVSVGEKVESVVRVGDTAWRMVRAWHCTLGDSNERKVPFILQCWEQACKSHGGPFSLARRLRCLRAPRSRQLTLNPLLEQFDRGLTPVKTDVQRLVFANADSSGQESKKRAGAFNPEIS